MLPHLRSRTSILCRKVNDLLAGPQALALVPALVLGGFWLGGEAVLLTLALGLPSAYAIFGLIASRLAPDDPSETADIRETVATEMDRALLIANRCGHHTACFRLAIDSFTDMTDQNGQRAAEAIVDHVREQVAAVLRDGDQIFLTGKGEFTVILVPAKTFNTDIALNLAMRLQMSLETPVNVDQFSKYVTVSIGICADTALSGASADTFLRAADQSLQEACRNAPSAIRLYAPGLSPTRPCSDKPCTEITTALNRGEILAWFQPQLCTDSGQISGFEALARWQHPERGLIPPSEFLSQLEEAGKTALLGTKIMRDGFCALNEWARQGYAIPRVGVNFSYSELRDPRLVNRIEWELDRHNLSPERLSVEILENVVATSPDDIVTKNIKRLSDIGCQIDLDDFGTGHASISTLRRFAVQRLKIDRSFVTKADRDREQQRMIAAILMMADQLGLDTLAEGVEAPGEHAMVAQLGCGHVQGFGIGRPMPFDRATMWIAQHLERLETPPQIGRRES